MCGWLVYETVEVPGGVVGGTLETEAVLPCLGALKKRVGLATPARQPLHPASPRAPCAPRIPSIPYSPISRPILLFGTLYRRKLPARPSGSPRLLRLTVDFFFKIRRSARRARETQRSWGSGWVAVRAGLSRRSVVRPWTRHEEEDGRESPRARVDRFCAVEKCFVRDTHRLGVEVRGTPRLLMTSARLSRLLHGRADQADTRQEGGRVVCVNRDIYFASSPPPWRLRPFSHLLRRAGSDVRAEYARGCTHLRCIPHGRSAAGANTQPRCGITPPFSRLLGTAQHPSSATSGQARLRPLLY